MIRILVVVPYEELYDQVRSFVSTIDPHGLSFQLEHLVGTSARVVKLTDVDIVVVRGITGRAIARENPSIHIVEISISSSDLLTALWKCRTCDTTDGVGVIVPDTEREEEVYAAIDELHALGVNTMVGGLTLCRRCEALGIAHVHIKTGDEAMRRAINEAVSAARSLNRERTRTNLITTVLNSSEDAVFAVNRLGQVIAANSQASQLFLHDWQENLEGCAVDSFFAGGRWQPTLETQVESEAIETINDQLLLVSYTPIMVDSESAGVLVTCKNIEAIRETEQKIRKELSHKGLVAHYHFGNILCENETMKRLIATAYTYSQVDSNVFIVGETGTGKELFAQSIHNASKRSSQPFVAVAVKGGRMGLFELAHKGTIFLDEIGEMPLQLQAKILRVLQEREIRRIGGDMVVPVDVRIISATNINIFDRVQKGLFRQDLYYRINLLNIKIPPLRQRPEDIDLIFRHFVTRYAKELGKKVPAIDPDVAPIMQGFHWQGNIRELRNFSERMAILNESGTITRSDVESYYLFDDRGHLQQNLFEHPRIEKGEARLPLSRLLAESGMDKDAFARSLGISRTTLWRRLREENAGL
jgi:propionate catabolism operon transcriptional regulator